MTTASSNTLIKRKDGYIKYESTPKSHKIATSKMLNDIIKIECKDKELLKAQCSHYKTILSSKSSNGTSD